MRILLAVILSIAFLAVQGNAEEAALKTQKDKVSYSIGLEIGNGMKRQAIDIDPDILAKGLKDALSGSKPLLTEEEIKETMTTLQKEMGTKIAEKNKKDGETFLTENKKKEGVKALASGLQYKIIKEGTGKMPKAADTVTVHYRGTLIDGAEFDSSYRHGQPASFPVNGVIAGWTEALQLMKTGSKWQLFIPSPLAYGERGAGREIGPNATLIFEVELLAVE